MPTTITHIFAPLLTYTTDRDRSRSPPNRERRDDRRRDRSPRSSSARNPLNHSDRDREYRRRDREASDTPPPSHRHGSDRAPARQAPDSRTNGTVPRNAAAPRKEAVASKADTRMQDSGLEDLDSEEEMQRIMGFQGFRSTKETKVPGNDKNYGVSKAKKSEYRQYMNRVGGFNRPLDSM